MKAHDKRHRARKGFCNKILVSRSCLRCGTQFPSISKSNRICIRCAAKREFSGTGESSRKPSGRQSLRPADCLTPDEAGALLGISGPAIKARIRKRTLKAVRTNDGRLWVKAADLGVKASATAPTKGKRNGSRRNAAERTVTFNLDAAKEFSFRVEQTRPQDDGNQPSRPGAGG